MLAISDLHKIAACGSHTRSGLGPVAATPTSVNASARATLSRAIRTWRPFRRSPIIVQAMLPLALATILFGQSVWQATGK